MKNSFYQLQDDHSFSIGEYHEQKPFSSFLPGIAGHFGVPMWVFYVNRAQAIASFGAHNKDGAILEFYPANKAYQQTSRFGFRTFLRFKGGAGLDMYEVFQDSPTSLLAEHAQRSMRIYSDRLLLEEVNRKLGLVTSVEYSTLPNESVAALQRKVTFKNISKKRLSFECVDGIPAMIPYGMNEWLVKNMSRTIEAWITVENVSGLAPFARLRVEPADTPEVELIHEGNFYFGHRLSASKADSMHVIVDPRVVFGANQDLSYPERFAQSGFSPKEEQIQENRTPSAFVYTKLDIAPGKTQSFVSYYGHARRVQDVITLQKKSQARDYYQRKQEQNYHIIESIKKKAFTVSSSPAFDAYAQQTYLDNVLRGGMPVIFGESKEALPIYVFSRKHGDLERDYNRFVLEPTFFSQGNGNYRDVNQNRRCDVWFEPAVYDDNIKNFLNLIQLDGGNPLVVKSSLLLCAVNAHTQKTIQTYFGKYSKAVLEFLAKPFVLGDFFEVACRYGVAKEDFFQLMGQLRPSMSKDDKADHGEGFWVDHWTYNLDLIESFIAIYPEDRHKLLFSDNKFTYYDNDHYIRARREKYFQKANGQVRQYESVGVDKVKTQLIASRDTFKNNVRTQSGNGDILKTSLFAKLLCLCVSKTATLDPDQVGLEMEADKPGWYDSLNGMPGLFGSSMCETAELKRLSDFMIQSLEQSKVCPKYMDIIEELASFFEAMASDLAKRAGNSKSSLNAMGFWQACGKHKELYRTSIRYGVSGVTRKIQTQSILSFLKILSSFLAKQIEGARDTKTGLVPTYFYYEAVSVKPTQAELYKNMRRVDVVKFVRRSVPLFLEGHVHAMKILSAQQKKSLWKQVRKSAMYDKALKMYKVNADIKSLSLEVGRSRVFTRGWLENESIWLHMEYKWLLETLKGGLCEEYYEDIKNALIPFLKPEQYGRSILENSSFIASSVFPDASMRGTGFVARLSGSTAEFLSMWLIMNIGPKPYALNASGELCLRLKPALPEFLFTTQPQTRSWIDTSGLAHTVHVGKNEYVFAWMGRTLIRYQNPSRKNCYGSKAVKVSRVRVLYKDGTQMSVDGDTLSGKIAHQSRDSHVISEIIAELS